MADYSGSWYKGFASTFSQAPSMILNVLALKEKKKAQKKIDDAVEELKLNSSTLAAKFDAARADGTIGQEEYGDMVAWALPLGNEIMGRLNTLTNNYRTLSQEQIDNELADINAFYELSSDLDFQNIEEMEAFGNNLTQQNAKTKWDLILKSIKKRRAPVQPEVFTSPEELLKARPGSDWEFSASAGGYIPKQTTPETPKMSDEKSAIDVLRVFANASPEQFNNQKAILEERTGLDLSNYTQDILKESGSEFFNLYNTPEEVMANVKAPAGLTVVPSRDSKTGKYYASFQKQAVDEKPTPEGEITAGQKRSWDMASSVLFGSSDWVTGISKPGIISQAISNKLNMGQALAEEDKSEVRNNYNAIVGTLPDEIKSVIESQLQRYGIPLEAPVEAPIPETTPEQPGLIEKGVTAVKDWLGMKGTPTTEEIPTPKVSPGAKEAMIPMMTKKELEDAIKGLDPSDPMYKLLYNEAVKRGYITK